MLVNIDEMSLIRRSVAADNRLEFQRKELTKDGQKEEGDRSDRSRSEYGQAHFNEHDGQTEGEVEEDESDSTVGDVGDADHSFDVDADIAKKRAAPCV